MVLNIYFAFRKITQHIYMRTIQFREAICEAMSEEMRNDESIYLMGEGCWNTMVLTKRLKACLLSLCKRVIDPIAELGFTGIAVGSAMNGNRPIVEYMTSTLFSWY
jgi:pyruvate dehydrogenase E1 component beta subunit